MVYIRINYMIRSVSTANIEEHDYALLSRLFRNPDIHPMLQPQKTFLGHVIQFIYFQLHSSAYQLFYEYIERVFFSNEIT